jgi:hypothetical protein
LQVEKSSGSQTYRLPDIFRGAVFSIELPLH